MKELSIIIVNYNKYLLTQKCIESVIETISDIKYEIIVIDNCSTNSSYEKLIKLNKNSNNVNIFRMKKNRGFGFGNNEGVKMSKYNNILILNPDVIVLNDSIKLMLDRMLEDNRIGIIGCQLLNEDNTLQYSCRRVLPLKDFIFARTPIRRFLSIKKVDNINHNYLMQDCNHKEEMNVDWLMGSCLMFRKADFFNVGGFSNEYFMYFEDVDLSCKFRKNGKNILYYPKAKMIHLHEQASVKKINKLTFIHIQSMIKFYKKLIMNVF